MKTHYCRVGTIRPNLNKVLNSTELKNDSIEQKTTNTTFSNKLSK